MQQESMSLGRIRACVTGIQYCEAGAAAGEAVHFEREPENRHDGNAIRVENPDCRKMGYLPRNKALWLAPLIDAGKISLAGRVPKSFRREEAQYNMPLELEVFLEPKGKGMLAPSSRFTSFQAAMHEIVLHAWETVVAGSDRSVAGELAGQLTGLADRDTLPETMLLLALFEDKAALNGRQAMLELLAGLKRVEIGEACHQDGLSIFPLFRDSGIDLQLHALETALQENAAEVGEVSEHGEVSRIRLKNRGEKPVLIPQGEMVYGARQDRVVLVSVVVEGFAEAILNVNCVEESRWTYESRGFSAGEYSHPELRRKIMSTLVADEDLQVEDLQACVWDEVSMFREKHGCQDSSSSLQKGMKSKQEELNRELKPIALPQNSSGVLVMYGEKLLGMDLFDSARTFRQFEKKLLQSYQFEALSSAGRDSKTDTACAESVLREILENDEELSEHPLNPEVINTTGDRFGKSILFHKDQFCHLTAFAHEDLSA